MKSRPSIPVLFWSTLFCSLIPWSHVQVASGQATATIVGVNVVPHQVEETMQFRRPRDPALAARVQLFVQGTARPERFSGQTPTELLASGEWAWHDLQTAVPAPADTLPVWTFNGKSPRWGVGQSFMVSGEGLPDTTIPIEQSPSRILSVTFLSSDGHFQPDTLCLHLANDTAQNIQLTGVRLWLPESGATWQILHPVKKRVSGLFSPILKKSPDTFAPSDQFLEQHLPIGKEQIPCSMTSLILVIARLLHPSSELHISEQWYDKTALADLLGVPTDRVDDNRLYRALDKLLPSKEALEVHLKDRMGNLFQIEYDLLLYDVTSTYFEGQAKSNPLAQRG